MIKKILCLLLAASQIATAAVITRPNTYTSGTVIDPAQVNSNESTIYTDYNGNIDNTNIKANGVAYSNLTAAMQAVWSYRRPSWSYVNSTTVRLANNDNSGSSAVTIIFPNGDKRTCSTTSCTDALIGQNAVFSGTFKGGLAPGETGTNNTSYAGYACEVTSDATNFTVFLTTNVPVQANYSTINTNICAANTWVYLGTVRYGDNSGIPGAFLSFKQAGALTIFNNTAAGQLDTGTGIRMATTASGASLTYTYAAGTGAAQIPSHILLGTYQYFIGPGTGTSFAEDASGTLVYGAAIGTSRFDGRYSDCLNNGIKTVNSSAVAMDIFLVGWYDPILGSGTNPQL